MEKTATFGFGPDFLPSFMNLPKDIQNRVADFVNKFRMNPKSSAINLEKVRAAADKKSDR